MQSDYQECDCPSCQSAKLSTGNDLKFKKVLKVAEKAFKKLFKNGSYKPEDLSETKEYQDLINATNVVFISGISHEVPQELRSYLEKDVFIFSGLKTHAQLTEARSYLKDNENNRVSYEAFEQKILQLNADYNTNYLQAEWQFVTQSSQSVANWTNLEDDTERYWLQYRTAKDDRVRVSHQALAEITLPKKDEFWNSFYPPNGWRCRCTTVEVLAQNNTLSDSKKAIAEGEKATTQISKSGKNTLEMFRFNPGKDKKIFPPKNTYTKVVGAEKVKSILKNES